MAVCSFSVSSMRSATSSAEVSKLTTMALSWPWWTTLWMNEMAASCSNLKRSRMLLLVSIRMPRRRGRSVSAVNSAMFCGVLFSNTWKSSFTRSVTKRPFLSVTVQEETLARRLNLVFGGRPIETVASYRMADAGEVHADLVRTAGADAQFQKSEAHEAAEDAVFGPGGAAVAEAGGHARAAPRIARDGLFDAAAIRLHVAVNQRQVGLLHLPAGEQGGQRAMRGVVLGHQNHAAGEAVQAMHDAGPQIAAQRGKRLEAAEQRVDQRAGMHSGAGVHHHACGLVDGHEVLVFVEHAQRNGFGFGA